MWVETQEALDPTCIGLLRPGREVLRSTGLAHLFEKPHGCRMARESACVNMQRHKRGEERRKRSNGPGRDQCAPWQACTLITVMFHRCQLLRIPSGEEALAEARKNDPLNEYFVWWDRITTDDVSTLAFALDGASREEDVQQFLQANPKFLIQHLGGGHGRWVIPKQKLGAEHVTDFLVAEKHSFGHEWQAIELESPLKPMFNKNGDPSQYLNHAIRQIQDWRAWLLANQNYAASLRTESGLGLTNINGNVPGLILIGRRSSLPEGTIERRRQMVHDLNIRIHTYDYLLEALKGRLKGLAMWSSEPITDET